MNHFGLTPRHNGVHACAGQVPVFRCFSSLFRDGSSGWHCSVNCVVDCWGYGQLVFVSLDDRILCESLGLHAVKQLLQRTILTCQYSQLVHCYLMSIDVSFTVPPWREEQISGATKSLFFNNIILPSSPRTLHCSSLCSDQPLNTCSLWVCRGVVIRPYLAYALRVVLSGLPRYLQVHEKVSVHTMSSLRELCRASTGVSTAMFSPRCGSRQHQVLIFASKTFHSESALC
jgi:hypothetical protein